MKTKREIAENQIRIQEKMQSVGFNVVTCGNCGSILLHEIEDETIECLCVHLNFSSHWCFTSNAKNKKGRY